MTSIGDESSNPLFAQSIVGRGVDEVDSGIEDSTENLLGFVIIHDAFSPRVWPTQSHAAVTKPRDVITSGT
jgi:hypothetical protein